MGRLRVTKTDGVDVVFVAGNTQDGLAALDVVDINAVIACASYDFTAITREANGPNAKVGMEAAWSVASKMREVEEVGLRLVCGVCSC